MSEKLVGAHRQAALREIRGWAEVVDRDAIRRTFHFADFSEAWGFMSRVALLAQERHHHPEWHNIGNRVEIVLSTHDVDGVTGQDIQMARQIDHLAARHEA